VVILGAIDLSVSGHIVGGGITVSQLYGADHWPAWVAILFIAVATAAMGVATGWICHRYRV
jgi:ribose transport system permease protein